MYCLLTVIFTWLVFESSYVGLYYVRKSHVILMCAFVTYCLVAAWCELTYGALRCEICLSFTVLVSAVVLFSRKIHPTLRSAHVGTGTGTQYTASLPLCYRYCDSYNPHRFMRIRRRDVLRKKQLCRSWRHLCFFYLCLLFFARMSWLKTRMISVAQIFVHNF
jgi:hypothetical protein